MRPLLRDQLRGNGCAPPGWLSSEETPVSCSECGSDRFRLFIVMGKHRAVCASCGEVQFEPER